MAPHVLQPIVRPPALMSYRLLTVALDTDVALSASELLVLLVLAHYADDRGGSCYPTQQTIARRARLTVRGVQKVLARLQAREILSVRLAGANRSARYQIDLGALTRTSFVSEANDVRVRGERRSSDPISDPTNDPDQEQCAARTRPSEQENPRLLTKIAHDVLREVHVGHVLRGDISEELKTRASRIGLRYDGDRTRKALDSAEEQQRRQG
jgi:hypothetical protein